MTRPIVAFCGLIGSGKSTAARRLVNHHGFAGVRFADPIKAMLRALGLSDAELDGALKELPCSLLGDKTPRWAMQRLGTEWGRQLIDPELWTRAWRCAVDRLPANVGVVADDCRFANEITAVRQASPFSLVVRIVRPGVAAAGHLSELQQFHADQQIVNDGSIEELRAKVDDLVLGTQVGELCTQFGY